MPTPNLSTTIRSLVADEVAAALAPYTSLLERMSSLFDNAPVRRGPGRPRKATAKAAPPAAPVRLRRRRGSKAKAAARAAKNLTVGQKVTFKMGRGAFEAKVVSIDAAKGTVELERAKDGKKVTRPAAKVTAA